jgi:hypothetical protein
LATDRVLSRPYTTVDTLQADTQPEVQLSVTVLLIKAEIDKGEGLTLVEVIADDSTLTKLELELPTTDFERVEALIAQELGLSHEIVRRLARYQVKD